MTSTATLKPATAATYSAWQSAYNHYNKALFAGTLPDCLITLQRKDHRSYGYFSPDRFGHMVADATYRHEIALNPMKFKSEGVREALQTLVHEMCHLWQHVHGRPTRGYHNAEWADKMESIGLMPSDTGKPGGARTGSKMADYCITGGPFDKASAALLAKGWSIDWYDRMNELQQGVLVSAVTGLPVAPSDAAPAKPNRTNRVRYTCGHCNARAWGKPGLRIMCGVHFVEMRADGT